MQAAQFIRDEILSPDRAVFFPEDHVRLFAVAVDENTFQVRHVFLQQFHQQRLVVHAVSVYDDADHDFPGRFRRPEKQMPQMAPPGLFLVDILLSFPLPFPEGADSALKGLRLE